MKRYKATSCRLERLMEISVNSSWVSGGAIWRVDSKNVLKALIENLQATTCPTASADFIRELRMKLTNHEESTLGTPGWHQHTHLQFVE